MIALDSSHEYMRSRVAASGEHLILSGPAEKVEIESQKAFSNVSTI